MNLMYLGQGDIEEIMPGLFVQVSDWLYHPVLGVQDDPDAQRIPASAWVVAITGVD
jgi:hypothetical protein